MWDVWECPFHQKQPPTVQNRSKLFVITLLCILVSRKLNGRYWNTVILLSLFTEAILNAEELAIGENTWENLITLEDHKVREAMQCLGGAWVVGWEKLELCFRESMTLHVYLSSKALQTTVYSSVHFSPPFLKQRSLRVCGENIWCVWGLCPFHGAEVTCGI